MNRDKSEDYLADGITEDITIAVAKNRWLTVVARNPAFSFRNSKESLSSIGQQLNARYLVTGSVRKAGSRFRIGVEMVDAAKGEGLFDTAVPTTWIVQAFDHLMYAGWESVKAGKTTQDQAAALAWRTLIHGLGRQK